MTASNIWAAFGVVCLIILLALGLSGCEKEELVRWCTFVKGEKVYYVYDGGTSRRFRDPATILDVRSMERRCWYIISFDDPHLQPNEVWTTEKRLWPRI